MLLLLLIVLLCVVVVVVAVVIVVVVVVVVGKEIDSQTETPKNSRVSEAEGERQAGKK